jgi:hypothetical protein
MMFGGERTFMQNNTLEFPYEFIIVIFCQVVQQLIVGDDFLTGMFIGDKEKFNLVLVGLQFLVMIFNHFDIASTKLATIWLCIHEECAFDEFIRIYNWRGCLRVEVLGIQKIVINVISRLNDVFTLPTKQLGTEVGIIRFSGRK